MKKRQQYPIDHTASTPEEATLFTNLDSVYQFMANIYPAYSRMRFRGAAFMKEPTPDLSQLGEESIADHMWAATVMWEALTPILPHLSSTVDTRNLSRFILIHDMGEIANGDISAALQLKGHGKNRAEKEMQGFNDLAAMLPEASRDIFVGTHDQYEREKNNPETQDKEVLLAKIMDMIQGDHFVLSQSIDFSGSSHVHYRIVSEKLVPYAKRLHSLLTDEGELAAAQELHGLIKHHLYQYQQKGTVITYD